MEVNEKAMWQVIINCKIIIASNCFEYRLYYSVALLQFVGISANTPSLFEYWQTPALTCNVQHMHTHTETQITVHACGILWIYMLYAQF